MHSEHIILKLDCFSNLLEIVHQCHKVSVSKVSGICSVDGKYTITFTCCNLTYSVDKLRIISSLNDSVGISSDEEEDNDGNNENKLEYENVLFIDDIKEPNFDSNEEFEGVFVNVEDESSQRGDENTSSPPKPALTPKIDPLFFDQNSNEDVTFSLGKSLSSNSVKISSRTILPKVVDWSFNSIETIPTDLSSKSRTKYPLTFVCEFCGLQFKGKDRVYKFFQHRNQSHTQEIKYICPMCQKVYWGERELSSHVVSHLNKENICEVCGVTFLRKNDLLRHLLTHKDKKFSCNFCSKSFRRKDHLQIHERIHTKNYIYVCKQCGSGFPQNRQLSLHVAKCKSIHSESTKKS